MSLAYQIMESTRLNGLDPADDAHCPMLLLRDVTGVRAPWQDKEDDRDSDAGTVAGDCY